MKSFLPFLLFLVLVHSESQHRVREEDAADDDEPDSDESSVKSKPVIVPLPKNRVSPELHSISSLKKQPEFRANEDNETPTIREIPSVVETGKVTLPNGPVPVYTPSPLSPPPGFSAKPSIQIRPAPSQPSLGSVPSQSPLGTVPSQTPLGSVPSQSPLGSVPSQTPLRSVPSQTPLGSVPSQSPLGSVPSQTPLGSAPSPQSPLNSAALAAGSGLTNILANNPSLVKLLQGVGAPPGLSGALGGPAGAPGNPQGQGGLLAQAQGALPSLGQSPVGVAGPPGSPDSGLLNVISSLGRQLGGAVGLNNVIPGAANSPSVGPSIPRISGLGGPPIAGIPNIPGLPVFPGSITPGGNLDVLQLISAVSRRALNGSSVTEVLPPNQIQKLADNLTDTLLPDTPTIDLTKYMGRWFEGIGSPRASDQRCVVHHYGGLTENGKTATYTALKIYREASEFGQVRYSIGYAFRGGRQPGMLQMHTSESPDPVPYWIYRIGPIGKDPFGNEQYEFAIVSNWIKYPVMVLVRDPDQFKRDHEESVLRWLEENGFINSFARAFNLIQPVSYQNCQYADSTFELFG